MVPPTMSQTSIFNQIGKSSIARFLSKISQLPQRLVFGNVVEPQAGILTTGVLPYIRPAVYVRYTQNRLGLGSAELAAIGIFQSATWSNLCRSARVQHHLCFSDMAWIFFPLVILHDQHHPPRRRLPYRSGPHTRGRLDQNHDRSHSAVQQQFPHFGSSALL
jgi:hypothetical protein